MAIYEYACKKCGNKFELMRSVAKRDDAAPCPKCKSKTPSRLMIQRVAMITGVAPDAYAGEGEPEDFMGMGGMDDMGGMGDMGGMDFDDDDY